jgi:hypothetical protein
MKKGIVSKEIEELRNDIKAARQKGDADEANVIWHRIDALNHLRNNHPELDYADELLEMVKELAEEHHRRHCGTFTPSFRSPECEKAQALLRKIEK